MQAADRRAAQTQITETRRGKMDIDTLIVKMMVIMRHNNSCPCSCRPSLKKPFSLKFLLTVQNYRWTFLVCFQSSAEKKTVCI